MRLNIICVWIAVALIGCDGGSKSHIDIGLLGDIPLPEGLMNEIGEGMITTCSLDEDCNDFDTCTVDFCNKGICVYGPNSNPGCCKDGQSLYVGFEGTDAGGFVLTPNIEGVGWTIVEDGKAGKGGELYFGNPETHNYDAKGKQAKGNATSPPIIIPIDTKKVTLSFGLYMDVEPSIDYDRFWVSVLVIADETGPLSKEEVVWDKSEIPLEAYAEKMDVKISLDKFIGKTIKIVFNFDTVDNTGNHLEGVYLDDISLAISCSTSPTKCANDSQCDDGNQCTEDICTNGTCVYAPKYLCCQSDKECDDGSKCTEDKCIDYQCTYKVIINCCVNDEDCKDNNPCTLEKCVKNIDGQSFCQKEQIIGCCVTDAECNDNDTCTKDKCKDNKCVYEKNPICCYSTEECNDKDPCTIDECNGGSCIHYDIADCCITDSKCNDNNPCTKDYCLQMSGVMPGKCVHEEIVGCCKKDIDCEDDNKCTADLCENGVCKHIYIPNCCKTDKDCNDNNPCTLEKCDAGQCISQSIVGCCITEKDCYQSTTNPCITYECKDNKCVSNKKPECCMLDADCKDDNLCTKDYCELMSSAIPGKCLHDKIVGCCVSVNDCFDGNMCTEDVCKDNICVHNQIQDCCNYDTDCKSPDVCTKGACIQNKCIFNKVEGCCINDNDCKDQDVCTLDKCVNNQCTFIAIQGCCKSDTQCDDGNPCTNDKCSSDGKCVYENNNKPCNDGNLCTTNDTCFGGKCVGGLAVNCDDNDPCTSDSCVAAYGCVHKLVEGCAPKCNKDSDCNDNDPCTQDKCFNKVCNHWWLTTCCIVDADCNDNNPCTDDICGLDNMCLYKPNKATCDDNDACTVGDFCDQGKCQPGKPVICNDNDPCTNDSCDPKTGVCLFTPIQDCCKPSTVWSANFDDGTVQSFSLIPQGTPVKWQVFSNKYHSPKYALYFGNPATMTFADPKNKPVSGEAVSPKVTLSKAKAILLKFWLYLDVETEKQFDVFNVNLVSPYGVKEVWNKSFMSITDYKQWIEVKINVTSYQGQTIQVQFSFDSVDNMYNDGEGIYIDDISIENLCEPIPFCNFDAECDDKDPCTQDKCINQFCVHEKVSSCCKADQECNDNYPCTTDKCQGNKCIYTMIPDCCIDSVECTDKNECTIDICENNKCIYKPSTGKGCCSKPEDCDDNDQCTKESCDMYKCTYSLIPNCCNPKEVYSQSFPLKSLGGFIVTDDGSDYYWQISNIRYYDPPFSLYFGNPYLLSYNDGGSGYGVAQSPSFTLPLYGKSSLTFWFYMDIDMDNDVFYVRLKTKTSSFLLWTSQGKWDPSLYKKWTQLTLDISKYNGQEVLVEFVFSGWANGPESGEGIYVDAIKVSTTCP